MEGSRKEEAKKEEHIYREVPHGYFFDEKACGNWQRPMYEAVNNLSRADQDPGRTLLKHISATKPVRPQGIPADKYNELSEFILGTSDMCAAFHKVKCSP